jgi:hypothetical protein
MRAVTLLLLSSLLCTEYCFGETPKNSTADGVSFNIRMGQADKGTEEYKISSSKGGYLLTSTVHLQKLGEHVFSQQQQTLASDWSPLHYSLKTTMARDQRSSEASIAGGKVTMHSESGKDVKEKTIDLHSPSVVFDNVAPSQFQVLIKQYSAMHGRQPLQFQLLAPQVLGEFSATLRPAGPDTGTLRNHKVPLEKYILETRGLNLEIWTDSQGQLMRVYLPARDTEFLRAGFSLEKKEARKHGEQNQVNSQSTKDAKGTQKN